MGLESYLLEICFKNPVPQTDIKDIIESAGASFLAGKSNIEPIDTYRNFYFEIRSDLGLTELYILLAPEKRVVTNFSLRFSILSPSSVIDQSFAFLNKLNTIRSINVIDADNKLKELDLSADQFKLNKNLVRKRQIIINNKTGLVIEGGAVTTEYIHNNDLMEKIWGQNITRTSPARWLRSSLFILILIFGTVSICIKNRSITKKTIFFDFIDYIPLAALCGLSVTQLVRLILYYRTNAARTILASLVVAAICLGFIVWHYKHIESSFYFKENGYLMAERSDHWLFTTYRGSYTIIKDTIYLDIKLDFALGKRAILNNNTLRFIDDTVVFEITWPLRQ